MVTSIIPLLYFNYTPLSSLSYLKYLVHPLSLIPCRLSFFLAPCPSFLLISCPLSFILHSQSSTILAYLKSSQVISSHSSLSLLILFHLPSLVPHHHSLLLLRLWRLSFIVIYHHLSSSLPFAVPSHVHLLFSTFNSVPSGALCLTFMPDLSYVVADIY